MEIPAKYFFSFWAVISFTFLKLGLDAIQKTELSRSVSPVVMYLFKFSLIFSSSYSYTYAVVFCRQMKISIEYVFLFMIAYSVPFNILKLFAYGNMLMSTVIAFLVFFFFKPHSVLIQKLMSHFTVVFGVLIHTTVLALSCIILLLFANKLLYAVGAMITILSCVFPYWKEYSRDKWLHFEKNKRTWSKWLLYMLPASVADPVERIFIFSKSEEKRWVEFAVGMAGTIVFQNFFRIMSFHEVVVLLFIAVLWLANTVLVLASHDLGVFNFLLGNVIIGGCTASEHRVRGTTWIAYGAAVVLYGLRVKLESVALVIKARKETQVEIF